jgi:hypothetical protein
MAINIKELKDDAIFDIKVNKGFYLMAKEVAAYLFLSEKDSEKLEESLKNMTTKEYKELNPYERSFYTITLLIAEIERVAKEKSLYTEKEILQPGDEGYVEPTQD